MNFMKAMILLLCLAYHSMVKAQANLNAIFSCDASLSDQGLKAHFELIKGKHANLQLLKNERAIGSCPAEINYIEDQLDAVTGHIYLEFKLQDCHFSDQAFKQKFLVVERPYLKIGQKRMLLRPFLNFQPAECVGQQPYEIHGLHKLLTRP